jgi:hypothetical protein
MTMPQLYLMPTLGERKSQNSPALDVFPWGISWTLLELTSKSSRRDGIHW